MGDGWAIVFKKPLCRVPDCFGKHYSKGFCRKHYDQWHRNGYIFNTEQYLNYKVAERRKEFDREETERKPEIPIKNKVTRELYQRLKEANIPEEFKYKDVMNITGWKYERVKKHILRLAKWGKIESLECHSGGGSMQGKFRLPVTLF